MSQPSPPPLLRSLQRLRGAFWRRRAALWLVRAVWLALLVPTLFMAGYLWLGWQPVWYYWLSPMLLVGFLALLWALRPIWLKKMAGRLDRRLGLRARLITAFEVGQAAQRTNQADNLVAQRLLQESVNILIDLRRHIRTLGRGFWLELQALIAVAALLAALLMLDALTPQLPNATVVELPASWQEPKAEAVLPPDAELFPPPFAQEPQIQQIMSQEQTQQALEALADALRDQAVTRSIAEALDRGDLSGAAEGLRRLADQLGELSEQARGELGQAMQEAAESMGENAPGLTGPLQSGSNALEQNDVRAAQQALEALAEAIESAQDAPQESAQAQPEGSGQPQENSGEPQPGEGQEETQEGQNPADQPQEGQGSGAGSGEEGEGGDQPTSEEERLGVEGQPLELESDPASEERVLQPAELDAEAGDETAEDSPFARQTTHTNGDLGPDPLAYPWQKRDVIRRYFTP
ncbi:MAG: hypothetical protein L6R45_14365 [Anaerolineae bacterium]|nr:hypothetical protein [Anaerolineae bacterium]